MWLHTSSAFAEGSALTSKPSLLFLATAHGPRLSLLRFALSLGLADWCVTRARRRRLQACLAGTKAPAPPSADCGVLSPDVRGGAFVLPAGPPRGRACPISGVGRDGSWLPSFVSCLPSRVRHGSSLEGGR